MDIAEGTESSAGGAAEKARLESEIVVYCNQKGGAGKTTTMMCTAEAMHQRGLRVLGLDVDKQGAASKWEARPKKGFARHPVRVERLSMRDGAEDVKGFYRAIFEFAHQYAELNGQQPEYILIDTPPDVESAELAASLFVSDLVVVPFKASGQFLNAAEETFVLFGQVNELRKKAGRQPLKIRVLRNFWKPNRPLPVSIFQSFQKRTASLKDLDIGFLEAAMKDLVAFEDISSYQTGLYSMSGTAAPRKAMEQLVDEILRNLK